MESLNSSMATAVSPQSVEAFRPFPVQGDVESSIRCLPIGRHEPEWLIGVPIAQGEK